MTPNPITKTIELGDGRTITIETGKLARQAHGSVVVTMGKTMLLATVVSAEEPREGATFMPLSVEYREKFASAGRIPGGFLKREARPSDHEILISRLIDRALRPLFPDYYYYETQIIVQMVSTDGETMPDSIACLAASAAVAVSNIPVAEVVSEVRVARINGELAVNPTKSELADADMDLIVAATMDNIMMVEGSMAEVSEEEMIEAIKVAHEAIKAQCQAQNDLAAEIPTAFPKRVNEVLVHNDELRQQIFDATYDKFYAVAQQRITVKKERSKAFSEVRDAYKEGLEEEFLAENGFLVGIYLKEAEKKAVRTMMLDDQLRLDGRQSNQVRPIWSEVDYLPGTHGSAVFTRGETQSLTTVTLGTSRDNQLIDGAFHQGTEEFLLHYNFPPFCTGEAKMLRGTSRREVGHGNLALRGLRAVMPGEDDNPYVVRVVSEILESNGSSSMATVCAGSMALMDAGIKIAKPVAGIAMGMIMDEDGRYMVLSDILGDEDHLGDMDFKVTGTPDGITATQMDIKIDGLSYEVLGKALAQAREGRLHILGEMAKTISAPNVELKPHAPRIETVIIPKDAIGAVIGPGGKVIQEIQAETETEIIIEEKNEKGYVEIFSSNKESIERAMARIRAIAAEPEVGEIYEGKVKSIVAFGAFVEVIPGKDGLLHISELDWKRVANVEDYLKEGDMVKVKLIEIDSKTGKLRLSRKVLLPKPEGYEERPSKPRRDNRRPQQQRN